MLYDESTAGQTFELYGPREYSMNQIAAMVDKEIFKKRRHINVPKAILKPVAGILNKALWWHTLSADEVEREFLDQVIDPTAKTFKDLGIEPGDIANFTYHYLVRHFLLDVSRCRLTLSFSKDSEASIIMTSLQRQKRRSGRIKSTYMCWTSCKEQHGWRVGQRRGRRRWFLNETQQGHNGHTLSC